MEHRNTFLWVGVAHWIVLLILSAGTTASAQTKLILTVGGKGSGSPDGCDGLALTGAQLDGYYRSNGIQSEHKRYSLPNFNVVFGPGEDYLEAVANAEAEIQRSVKNADAQTDILLMGYSHGATAALRALHALAETGSSLHRVLLVTIDRVIHEYPLPAPPTSLPSGLARALNIFQQVDTVAGSDSVFGGSPHGRLRGALEVEDVGNKMKEEAGEWLRFNPLAKFCTGNIERRLSDVHPTDGDSGGPHRFMQYSELVKREIFHWLGINYFGGLWEVSLTGAMRDGTIFNARPPEYFNPVNLRETFMVRDFTLKQPGNDLFAAMWTVERSPGLHADVANSPDGFSFAGSFSDRGAIVLDFVSAHFGERDGDDVCFRVQPAVGTVDVMPDNLLQITLRSQRSDCRRGVYFEGVMQASLLELYRTRYLPSSLPWLTLVNLSNPVSRAPHTRDQVMLAISGAPSDQPVYLRLMRERIDLGVRGPYGRTNNLGEWSSSISFTPSDAAAWQIQAIIGDEGSHRLSETLTFTVAP